MRKSRYLEAGRRVEYEIRPYNSRETIKQTGTILSMLSRQSVGYKSTMVCIKSDHTGQVVFKYLGGQYGDKIKLLEEEE
ncbi:MAG: hypothetical protein KAS38_09560 [Anaerolineales bacterium]|nr:hypothetical protein [Anaerolineales bacterium]